MPMTTVAIVEDDAAIRDGLRKYLSHQPDVLCEICVPSVEDFFRTVGGGDLPQIVLMDIGLPGMSGIDGMRLIRERNTETDVIMLTIYTDWQRIFEALRAGASGYLVKNPPLAEIKQAIENVRAGGAAMSSEIARRVLTHFAGPPMPKPEAALTPREKELVVALVDGLSYKMIAGRMDVSIDTIRFHIKNIYRKLEVNSKGEVIARSLRGLL